MILILLNSAVSANVSPCNCVVIRTCAFNVRLQCVRANPSRLVAFQIAISMCVCMCVCVCVTLLWQWGSSSALRPSPSTWVFLFVKAFIDDKSSRPSSVLFPPLILDVSPKKYKPRKTHCLTSQNPAFSFSALCSSFPSLS